MLETRLIVIPIILQLFGLAVIVSVDPYIRKKQKNIMLVIMFLIFALLVRDLVAHRLDLIGTMPYERTICAIAGYIIRPVVIVLYMYIIKPTGSYGLAWGLTGINAVVYLTALFSDI